MSAGYDGLTIVWDVSSSFCIFMLRHCPSNAYCSTSSLAICVSRFGRAHLYEYMKLGSLSWLMESSLRKCSLKYRREITLTSIIGFLVNFMIVAISSLAYETLKFHM